MMNVSVIASTTTYTTPGFEPTYPATDADHLAEYAGRSCYQSFDRPNPATADNRGYMANIVKQGHFSVLEHASVSFYVTGVSRALTHELVRHRHLSFSQLSQRFVDETYRAPLVTPPGFRDSTNHRELANVLDGVQEVAVAAYAYAVELLMDDGYTRKAAREAARAVLPNATETRLVVTGNHRAWRDFLGKRWTVHADAEIRQFAGLILTELRDLAPESFRDLPLRPAP